MTQIDEKRDRDVEENEKLGWKKPESENERNRGRVRTGQRHTGEQEIKKKEG